MQIIPVVNSVSDETRVNSAEAGPSTPPGPQTIGLFVSYSGVYAGGRAVVRRAVNTKTVIIFGRDEIKEVMSGSDPVPIFDEKPREPTTTCLRPEGTTRVPGAGTGLLPCYARHAVQLQS